MKTITIFGKGNMGTAIGFLQIKLAASENISWNNGFALID